MLCVYFRQEGKPCLLQSAGIQVNRAAVPVFNNANHQAEQEKKTNSGGPDTGNQTQGMSPEVIRVIFITKRIELVTCLLCDQVGKLDMGKEHKGLLGKANLSRNPQVQENYRKTVRDFGLERMITRCHWRMKKCITSIKTLSTF